MVVFFLIKNEIIFSLTFFSYFSRLFIKNMIGKINFSEIVVSNQLFLFVAIFLGLLLVFGVFKLIQLIRKVKKQKANMQNLVKEYEDFLNQRGKK